MNISRRSLFGLALLAPIAATKTEAKLHVGIDLAARSDETAVEIYPRGSLRLSVEEGDAGELEYAKLLHMGFVVEIYLDGIKQTDVVTADEKLGFIRKIYFKSHRSAYLIEDLYGSVVIKVLKRSR